MRECGAARPNFFVNRENNRAHCARFHEHKNIYEVSIKNLLICENHIVHTFVLINFCVHDF